MTKGIKKEAAQHHMRVRRQHSRELAQDYVEAIYEFEQGGAAARVTDLQGVFGVSHVSIIRALRRLDEQGFVRYSKEAGIQLTEQGTNLAKEAAERHALLVQFFVKLGVAQAQADADAEGAEHHLSEETYSAIRRFIASE